MKGVATKLDDLSKVFIELTEEKRDTLLKMAKKLLKVQKSNDDPSPIEEKRRIDWRH